MSSGSGRRFGGFWGNAFRVKSPRYSPPGDGDPRYSTWLDLTNVGLTSSLALGVTAITGQVTAYVAGPAALFSIGIAAIAAVLSAMCFAEYRSRWPRVTGNAYEYTYLSIGEAVAFGVGWCSLVEFCAVASASARAVSQNLDCILDNRILNNTRTAIGYISAFHSYPDLMAGAVTLVTVVLVTCGCRKQKVLDTAANVAVVLVVVFMVIVGVFHLHFDLWANTAEFFPYGFSGVLSGAATFFYAFSNFEVVCSKSDITPPSTKWPTVIALGVVMTTCLVTYMGIASILTLVSPISGLHTESPLPESFANGGVPWIKYIFCVVAIFLLVLTTWSALCQMYEFLYSASIDALLSAKFSEVNDFTSTAIPSALVVGTLAALFAVLFSLTDLLQLASLSSLLVSIVTCAASLCLRYRPLILVHSPEHTTRQDREAKRKYRKKKPRSPSGNQSAYYGTVLTNNTRDDCQLLSIQDTDDDELIGSDLETQRNKHKARSPPDNDDSSDTDIDEVVEEYKETLRVAALTSCSFPSGNPELPSEVTARRAAWAVVSFVTWLGCMSAILVHGVDNLKEGNVAVILFLIIFLILTFVSLVLLLQQPQESTSVSQLYIHTPLSPWIPLIAIIFDVHLVLCLSSIAWVQFLIILFLGALVYFLYGIRNSRASHFYQVLPEEERILLPEPPRHQVESRLLESHSPPTPHASYHPANSQVQPFFMAEDVDTVLID